MKAVLSIIVAVAENGVIGRDNHLPWRLGTDLARFRRLTWGKPMIMGRRNWDSIGRPLPGRETVVLTRQLGFAPAGAHVAHGWEGAKAKAAALAREMGTDEVAVVGGAEVYRLALPEAARIHLTRVHTSPAGDVLFPDLDVRRWTETFRQSHPAGNRDDHAFTFVDLVRQPSHQQSGPDSQSLDAAGR